MARSGSGEGGKERGCDQEVDWMCVKEWVLVLVCWCTAWGGGGGGGEVVAGGHDPQPETVGIRENYVTVN